MMTADVTVEECGAGLLPAHTHENPHACLIFSGSMIDRAWNKQTTPGIAGDLLINPGGTEHTIEVSDEGLGCIIIEWPQTVNIDGFRRVHCDEARLSVLSKLMLLQSQNPARRIIVQSEIASSIWRAANYRGCDGLPEWLGDARTAIRDMESPQLVADLSRWAGVHRATLTKWFREAYGLSPEKYKMLLKLERAAALLLSGERLAAAAPAAGFSDQAHMTRAWNRYLGETPNQWLRASATIVQDFPSS